MKTQHLYSMKSGNKFWLYIFVLTCSLCFTSCNYFKVRNNVRALINLEMIFPDSMMMYLTDSIDMEISEIRIDKPMILYWIDSVDCSTCIMNSLYHWETVMEYGRTDSIDFCLAFIISPPKSETEFFLEVVKHKKLTTPVYIDTENFIAENNPTLANQMMTRVFLLDCQRRIKAIGDPTLNQGIWELYSSMIKKITD